MNLIHRFSAELIGTFWLVLGGALVFPFALVLFIYGLWLLRDYWNGKVGLQEEADLNE